MRITLIISTLGTGGAERAMSVLANYWAEHGREVTLITLAQAGEDFYALHPKIHRVGLGVMGSSAHFGAVVKNNLRQLATGTGN